MTGVMLFRKFFGWYTKGIPDIKPYKENAFQAKTREELLNIIKDVLQKREVAQPVIYSA
jgi:tRNA-dihydrouridine synthase